MGRAQRGPPCPSASRVPNVKERVGRTIEPAPSKTAERGSWLQRVQEQSGSMEHARIMLLQSPGIGERLPFLLALRCSSAPPCCFCSHGREDGPAATGRGGGGLEHLHGLLQAPGGYAYAPHGAGCRSGAGCRPRRTVDPAGILPSVRRQYCRCAVSFGIESALWLFGLLVMTVGVPFFVVAATVSLLQRWFSAPAILARPLLFYGASTLAACSPWRAIRSSSSPTSARQASVALGCWICAHRRLDARLRRGRLGHARRGTHARRRQR